MRFIIKNSIYFIIIFFILIISGKFYIDKNTTEIISITVTEKERITTGYSENLTHKYLIFTENEVFENTDTIFFGKFNSSVLQGKLKVGGIYQVKVTGYRIPFLSVYRNIIKIIQ